MTVGRPGIDFGELDRIMVCLRYGIGDVLMETPVLDRLREAAPDARITALGAAPATELLEHDPVVDEVVDMGAWGVRHRWDSGDEGVRAAIRDWLAGRAFDIVLDPGYTPAAVAEEIWAGGLPCLEAEKAVADARVAAGGDAVQGIKAAVESGWGLSVSAAAAPRLRLLPADERFARRFLARRFGDVTPIGISQVASNAMKRWPLPRFPPVADALAEALDRPVLLFVGEEEEAGRRLAAEMRHADRAVVLPAIHLRKTGALLKRCSPFVSPDTGLMHMAAAMGTPTVGIFGPSPPSVYLPAGEHTASVGGVAIGCGYRKLDAMDPPDCWTAGRCLVDDHPCTWRVEPEEVVATTLELCERLGAPVASGAGSGRG